MLQGVCDFSFEPRQGRDRDGEHLGQGFELKCARHVRPVWKVNWEIPLIHREVFVALCALAWDHFVDMVDHQKRIPIRLVLLQLNAVQAKPLH